MNPKDALYLLLGTLLNLLFWWIFYMIFKDYIQSLLNIINRLIAKYLQGKTDNQIYEEEVQKMLNEAKQKGYNEEPKIPNISELISKLEQLGYYKLVDPKKIKNIKKNSIKSGYIYGWEESKRDFMSDAENLAEGDVGKFIKEIQTFLKHEKVGTLAIDDNCTDTSYTVTINEDSYVIYTENELNNNNINIWQLAAERCFGIINTLLRKTGSKERIFIIYGGNDLRGVFLTEEMYQAIVNFKEVPESEKPLKVSEYSEK